MHMRCMIMRKLASYACRMLMGVRHVCSPGLSLVLTSAVIACMIRSTCIAAGCDTSMSTLTCEMCSSGCMSLSPCVDGVWGASKRGGGRGEDAAGGEEGATCGGESRTLSVVSDVSAMEVDAEMCVTASSAASCRDVCSFSSSMCASVSPSPSPSSSAGSSSMLM